METHTRNRVNQEWPEDDPRDFVNLTDAEREALLAWIAVAMRPAERVGPSDSYVMKHDFETVGFYVTNGQMKGAQIAAGYQPVKRAEQNWRFRQRPTNKHADGYSHYHALPDDSDPAVRRFKELVERVRAGRAS